MPSSLELAAIAALF